MEAMTIIIYVFSASFILMTLALLFAYRRTGHYGLFLMALTYGASAGLAIVLMHWWPLATGFVLVWVLKLVGLDPGTDIQPRAGDPKQRRSEAKQ
jgi:hypothetical protein